MNIVRALWRLLDRRQRLQLVRLQGVSLVMACATLAGIAGVVPFFAVLGDPAIIQRSRLLAWLFRHLGLHSATAFLPALGAAFLVLVLLSNIVNLAGALLLHRYCHRVGLDFSVALFDEYIHRPHQFHKDASSATLFSNVIWEVTRGVTSILQSLFSLTSNAAAAVLIMLAIVILNPLIGLLSLGGLGGCYGLIYLGTRRRLLRNGRAEGVHAEERARIVNQTLGGIREIIVMHAQWFFRDRYARAAQSLSAVSLDTYAISVAPRYLLECIVVAGLVGTALYLLNDRASGDSWLAKLSFLGFAAYRLLPAFQQIFNAIVKIRADRAAFHKIDGDLELALAGRRRRRSLPNRDRWVGRPHSGIHLDEVAFHYGRERLPTLQKTTLRIAAGTTVGLVGRSGAGKTTLAELVLGLLTPTSGRIRIDDAWLDEANRPSWRAAVGYVPQQSFLFDATLAENIALATHDEHIDLKHLAEALSLAQLDELVSTFPRGHQQLLGEHGVRLSGGQRQRVGIARALYRRASMLILDEATNALDRMTEDEIMMTLEQLRGSCTILVIAHRLSTLRHCDQIFELDGGAIVASGTYDELQQSSAGFRALIAGARTARVS